MSTLRQSGFGSLCRRRRLSWRGKYAPGKTQIGRISITTNDPHQPLLKSGVVGTGLARLPTAEWGNDFVAVTSTTARGPNSIRQRSSSQGNFDIFVPASSPYEIVIFDPDTGLVSHGFGTTGPSGRGIDMTATLVFGGSTAPETDSDGLPDDVEFAIGTALAKSDTDGDGLDDFVEIQEGLDPFGGRAFPTGIIANVALQGQAKEVVLEGSTLDPTGQIAYVATGNASFAISASVAGFDVGINF